MRVRSILTTRAAMIRRSLLSRGLADLVRNCNRLVAQRNKQVSTVRIMRRRLLGMIVTWWADHTFEMIQQEQASKAAAAMVSVRLQTLPEMIPRRPSLGQITMRCVYCTRPGSLSMKSSFCGV